MISGLGFYHEVMTMETYQRLKEDSVVVEDIFKNKARERLLQWIALADERLSETGLTMFMTGGNDDDEWVALRYDLTAPLSYPPCHAHLHDVACSLVAPGEQDGAGAELAMPGATAPGQRPAAPRYH